MADSLRIKFGPIAAPRAGVLVVFCDDGLRIGSATRAALGPAVALIERVAGIEQLVTSLKKRKVPVWFLMANDEGHGFAKKANADYSFLAQVKFIEQTLLK